MQPDVTNTGHLFRIARSKTTRFYYGVSAVSGIVILSEHIIHRSFFENAMSFFFFGDLLFLGVIAVLLKGAARQEMGGFQKHGFQWEWG